MSRITWFKHYHGTAFDPKFKVVAIEANSTRITTLAVWVAVLELSSENEDRGSVLSFDGDVVAAGLDLDVDEVRRIWDAFIARGMIAGNRIANWDKRQGEKIEKPRSKNAEAVARHREKKKKAVSAAASVTRITGITSGITPPLHSAALLEEDSDLEKEEEVSPHSPPKGGDGATAPNVVSIESGRARRSDRGTRLPIDWQPDPDDIAFATERGIDPAAARDEFVDYWCAQAGRYGIKLDWSRTWRNRCRDLANRGSGGGSKLPAASRSGGPVSTIRAFQTAAKYRGRSDELIARMIHPERYPDTGAAVTIDHEPGVR